MDNMGWDSGVSFPSVAFINFIVRGSLYNVDKYLATSYVREFINDSIGLIGLHCNCEF